LQESSLSLLYPLQQVAVWEEAKVWGEEWVAWDLVLAQERAQVQVQARVRVWAPGWVQEQAWALVRVRGPVWVLVRALVQAWAPVREQEQTWVTEWHQVQG
jgi:hypothetical protein